MEKPLVSIIMPSFNSEKTIAQSIESVLSQSYENWELIITDDVSTDSTCAIVERFSRFDSRIKLHCLDTNSGAGIARNNSIKYSNGRFIAFLDSDDLWTKDKLDVQIDFMLLNKIPFSFSYYEKFTSDGSKGVVTAPETVGYNSMLYNNVIGCLTAIYDVSILGKCYMPSIRKRQDLGLWLMILDKGFVAKCVPQVLAKYRLDTGMTRNKFTVLKYQWEFYREVLKFGCVRSFYTFFLYALYGTVKYLK
ncbi:glycosyltransferase family 2 protein [Shewanella insulae]|uniref:glycosyltransferase family 2 protein n=1 Tax=Shewanella insulae TaxID=2681496 RepID=UPI002481374D|nr:glycosyltransferase family 2 protein [Shewanella insulae]